MPTQRHVPPFGTTCLAGGVGLSCFPSDARKAAAAPGDFPVSYSAAAWRKRLSPRQYAILRGHGTEPPNSSPLNSEHRRGAFFCAGCDAELFASAAKFSSGTGWPSFWETIESAVGETRDFAFGMVRTEVHCARCGGHLGHVFNDGPEPTGRRYCINGDAMIFRPTAS